MARAQVTSKGQVTVPKQIRDLWKIEPGDVLEFESSDRGLVVTILHRRGIAAFRGLFRQARALDVAEERRRSRSARAARRAPSHG